MAKQVFRKSYRRKKSIETMNTTANYVVMFREQDMFDRELFVDSTRSVSVVLGEKDNKSVNQNILK